MTAILMPSGRLRYHATINGAYGPAVGYKLYTYEAGTTTPKATYSDSDGVTPLANPIVLDANGECAPYGFGAYKLKLTDSAGAEVWTQDNVVLTTDTIATEWCGTAGGTADAITLSPSEAITAYASGQRFQFVAAAANTTAVTIAVSGLTAKALTWNGNTALAANDLVSGRIYAAQYDGTRFQLSAAPVASAAADDTKRLVTTEYLRDQVASDTAAGLVELATDAEYVTGTDAARSVTPAVARANNIVAVASVSASGTSVDFTGIPAWAKRINVMFSGLSTNGTSVKMLRLGDAGGPESSGYLSATSFMLNGGSIAVTNYTDGFSISGNSASDVSHGSIVLTKLTGNSWICAGTIGFSSGAAVGNVAGSKSTSATLDRIQLTTQGGTDTFDAGTVSITYE